MKGTSDPVPFNNSPAFDLISETDLKVSVEGQEHLVHLKFSMSKRKQELSVVTPLLVSERCIIREFLSSERNASLSSTIPSITRTILEKDGGALKSRLSQHWMIFLAFQITKQSATAFQK